MPVNRLILLATLASATLGAQSPAQAPATAGPAFEVASVKPNTSGPGSSSSNDQPGGYVATNIPLRRLIAFAYRLNPAIDRDRIVGPSWIDNTRYDVTARMPAGGRTDQIPDMLRALLIERFKLAVHTEMREEPVYALVRVRNDGPLGPQLTRSSLDCSKPEAFLSSSQGVGAGGGGTSPGDKPQCGIISNVDANGAVMRGGGRSISDLARNLTGRVNRTVVDRTGLTGAYDFTLRWTPDNFQNPSTAGDPSRDGTVIFTALQEQLGLKLETQRGPAEVLIIDHVERPTPD